MTRLVILKFPLGRFKQEEMEEVMEGLGSALPTDTEAIALPHDIEMLDEDDVGEIVDRLTEVVEDG